MYTIFWLTTYFLNDGPDSLSKIMDDIYVIILVLAVLYNTWYSFGML